MSLGISSNAEGPHGVEDGYDGDADVGEDGEPQGAEAEGGEEQDGGLDADGQPTSARLSTGASLMPSPTKARLVPLGLAASSSSKHRTLSAGSRPAR